MADKNSSAAKRGRLIGTAILLCVLAFYAWLHWQWLTERQIAQDLQERGIRINAEVIGPAGTSGGFRDHSDLITYRYTVSGKTYTNEESVWSNSAASARPGATVRIAYLNEAPETARLHAQSIPTTLFWAAILFDLVALCAVAAVFLERRIKRGA